MQQQKSYQEQLNEWEIRYKEDYYRFVLWVSYKKPRKGKAQNSRYYGKESNVTVAQIYRQHATEVIFDRKKGYDDLVALAEKLKGEFKTAILFYKTHRDETGKWISKEIRKYVGSELVEWQESKFTATNEKAHYKINYAPDKSWKLEAIPTPTQFKQLVTQAVQTPTTTPAPSPGVGISPHTS